MTEQSSVYGWPLMLAAKAVLAYGIRFRHRIFALAGHLELLEKLHATALILGRINSGLEGVLSHVLILHSP